MKNNDQGGFILMITIFIVILGVVIFFAVTRIINANSSEGENVGHGYSKLLTS